MTLEVVKIIITILFILGIAAVLLLKNGNLKWITGLIIAHSVIIFAIRMFIENQNFVNSLLSIVYFIIISATAVLVFRAMKYNQ